jgi:hypothetical protein
MRALALANDLFLVHHEVAGADERVPAKHAGSPVMVGQSLGLHGIHLGALADKQTKQQSRRSAQEGDRHKDPQDDV